MTATPLLVFALILLGSVAGEATKEVKPIHQGGRCFGGCPWIKHIKLKNWAEIVKILLGNASGGSQPKLDDLVHKVVVSITKELKVICPIHQYDQKLDAILGSVEQIKQEVRLVKQTVEDTKGDIKVWIRKRLSKLENGITNKLDNIGDGGGSDGVRTDIKTIIENINKVSNKITNVKETVEIQKGDGGGGVSSDVSDALSRIERKLRHINSKSVEETVILNRVESKVSNVMDVVNNIRTTVVEISHGGGGGGGTTPSSAVPAIVRNDKRILSIVQRLLQIAKNAQADIQEKYESLISRSSSSLSEMKTSIRNIMTYLTNISGDLGNYFKGIKKEIVKSTTIIETVRKKVDVTQSQMSAYNTLNNCH